MEHQVFVYGTLKQGFRNFHINHGRRVPGEFITVQPHALLIVGDYWLPWLLLQDQAGAAPGEGFRVVEPRGVGQRVVGQLYTVDDAGLAAMDKLEQVDEAGWYQRRRIAVQLQVDQDDGQGDGQGEGQGQDGAPVLHPWVYFGSQEGLVAGGQRGGPVAEYTLAHQELLPRELWPLG